MGANKNGQRIMCSVICTPPVEPAARRGWGIKDTQMGDSAFLVDIPSGWNPRAKQQPTRLIAYSANCVVRAALFKSRLP